MIAFACFIQVTARYLVSWIKSKPFSLWGATLERRSKFIAQHSSRQDFGDLPLGLPGRGSTVPNRILSSVTL